MQVGVLVQKCQDEPPGLNAVLERAADKTWMTQAGDECLQLLSKYSKKASRAVDSPVKI